ncbi:abscisic acid-responsive (TB2/DP1, HVA22) family protein [Artemisia annua]|uniref:HVA22-like protein n=1 Tax=Artemisia annua TaxID=35608 RepID=A0A2U1LZP2_ARTAN|nr:abscisic acid-responsive (TB2/DP1, HVA22) family protein [Artemisia annua]
MIGSFLTRGLVMVFGYAYPAYECFKTVEKNKPDIEQLRFWCQYWILVAVLTVGERIGDTFISWVPMYSEAKLAFYIYLWYPKTKGTAYVYDSFFRPYISKHETDIDRNLSELRTMAGDMAVSYWQRAASYIQTRTFDIIQYVASQSTPKPRTPQPKQPAKTRQPAPKHKEKIAAQQETKEQPAPAASSSSSSSSSGSHEIDQSDAEWTPPVPPKAAAVKAQKTSLARSQTVPTEVITTTEAEETQIEPSGSSSLKTNSSPAAPKETTMEEPVRVTRARLRKASSIQ